MGIISAYSISLLFLCCVGFYSVSARHQWKVLLGGSLIYFGLVSPFGTLILFANTLVSYICAKVIFKKENHTKQKIVLCAAMLFFVLSWLITKFFFVSADHKIFLISTKNINETVITLGCSYFVLRYISYTYDVYKGKIIPENNFLKLVLYYCYLPAILQGPIERYQFFSKNVFTDQKIRLTYSNVKNAGKLILTGLFKVYVISRFCAHFTTYLNNSDGVHGFILLFAIFLYSFQIFTDFSGGIDIVRGISYLFGVELSENFCRPYLSQTFTEFWRRWHMTFSSWLKDYIYIPLGGSRKGKILAYINLMIVFVVSAVWHGVGLTFLIWGALQALYVCVERFAGKSKAQNLEPGQIPLFQYLLNAAKIFLLSTFSWIFFHADSLGSVRSLVSSLMSSARALFRSGLGTFSKQFTQWITDEMSMEPSVCAMYVFIILVSVVLHILKDRKGFDITDSTQVCAVVRWGYYTIMLAILMFMGYYGNTFSASSFIYGGF